MPVFIHTRPAKMPFFQRQCYGPDPSFAPLVRLLNDWDTIARDSVHQRRYHRTGQTFTPKFDVIETENEYQLHGELGGVSKENLNIEFTDEHTLVVKGRVQKSYKASSTQQEAEGTPADQLAAETEAAVAATTGEDDIEESTIIDVPVDARASHQASVSDEEDEERTIEKQDAAAIEALQQEKRQEEEKQRQREQQQQQQPQEPAYKYWLAERSVGEFTRVFKFPGRVERDAVTAGLENGILTVTVPKAKALAVREIPIF